MGKAWVAAASASFVLAAGFYAAMRLYARSEVSPGDDTPFTLLLLVPAALLAGTAISVVGLATKRAPLRPMLALLILNGGLLAGFVLLAGVGLAAYHGR